jgi:copper chaperone CopZ
MGIREGIREFFSSKDDSDYPDSYQQYRVFTSPYGRDTPLPVLELRVPLCCDKCEKKVQEALEDCSGVKEVICDRERNRVTVTGFVDPLKALRKVKKVKPKSDLHGDNTYINRTSVLDPRPMETTRYVTNPMIRSHYPSDYDRYDSGRYVAAPVMGPLVRVNSYGRRMNRMPSFSRAERYDDRHGHQAAQLVPLDLQRDHYGIRRMPSFDRHRYHDAEYISMGNEYSPSIPETRYVSLYNKRPADIYRRQVSFSKLPVMNPHYMKHVEHEYNY